MEHGLGRNPSPKDERDYKLSAFIPARRLDLSGSKKWDFLHAPLDQGETGHCVGFGGADFGINLPIQDDYSNQDGHDFYYQCKVIDGEPGQENGSNVRSIAKVLQNIGRIPNYAFAMSTDEITYWLLNQGPLIVGTDWTASMFDPDMDNIICPTGAIAGGHCYILNEKTENNLYHLQNSWNGWGVNGGAYISIDDFAYLLRNEGEAMTAVELPIIVPPVPKPGCWAAVLKSFGLVKGKK
jgi:hypothetical protein